MRHFLQYWRTYNPATEYGKFLDSAASAQFRRVQPGDTIWIVALREQRLTLVGRLIIGEVISRREALKRLGRAIYDAPLVVLAKRGTELKAIEKDIQGLAGRIRFKSKADRLSLKNPQRTDGKEIQALRELTAESAGMLAAVLSPRNSGDNSTRKPRVLFARLGWMTHYAGPQDGDEEPIGGGRNNKISLGHEAFNFAEFNGTLYGFVRASNGKLNLGRIDPLVGDESHLGDVLVIFVAGQRIVGWYKSATVYAGSKEYPTSVAREIQTRATSRSSKRFKLDKYCFECSVGQAVLLPLGERSHKIPGAVKGGFGESNVCYAYATDGTRKIVGWIDEAMSYVLGYEKGNLLEKPNADDSGEGSVISQEQAAGFQSNPLIRKAVELFAMRRAQSTLAANGYERVEDTSKFKPYDFVCERDGQKYFIEVKGTQTSGDTLILTRGEVEHINGNPNTCVLVLVHSLRVSANGKVDVRGGTVKLIEGWRLNPADLNPVQYQWTCS
jgi:hypothetical protein